MATYFFFVLPPSVSLISFPPLTLYKGLEAHANEMPGHLIQSHKDLKKDLSCHSYIFI